MLKFKVRFWLPVLFCIYLIPGCATAGISISPSSATILNDPSGSAQFKILGISPSIPFSSTLRYLPNGPTGWASLTVNGNTITVQLNGSSSFPQSTNPNEPGPQQGTYGLYLIVQVGEVTYQASLLVYLFPTDNQFLFTDSKGNDINAQNGGVTLTPSSPNASITILYANLSASQSQKESFKLSPDSSSPWLSVSPPSGTTPAAGVLISATPGLSTPQEGFILVNDTGNQNQNAKLPVHFVVQGTVPGQQLPPDGTTVPFSYGSAALNNGSSGFLIKVPNANAQLTVSAGGTQPIQLYARYGTDVDQNGGLVEYDATNGPGTAVSLTLGPATAPPLSAGTWYFAIQTLSGQLSTGFIAAGLTSVQAPCTYSLSSPSASPGSSAGTGAFTLTTQAGCSWSASSDSAWLHITSSTSGTGTAAISYSYDVNSSVPRTGNISVAGLTFTVNQAAGLLSAPQIQSFTATPATVSYGTSSTLSWSVIGATSVSIDQGIGSVSSSGNYVVTPGRTRTYTLVAQNGSGSNTSTTSVTVTGQPPSGQQILTATPNPVLVTGSGPGLTSLNWNAPSGVQNVELHVNAPNGPVFTGGGPSGSVQTGQWVSDGMVFYLQDVTGGKQLTIDNTLDTVTVRVVPTTSTFFSASPLYIAPGQNSGTVLLTWNAPGVSAVQIWISSATGSQMTGDLPSSGWAFSGNWAQEGMSFYLQQSISGSAKGASNTIATAQVSSDPTPSP